MKNGSQVEVTMKHLGDRIMGVFREVGSEAWVELKQGIDKAWEEIKIGIDQGLDSATQGINKGWKELSTGIDRAKDELFMYDEEGAVRPMKNASHGSKTRKERLS